MKRFAITLLLALAALAGLSGCNVITGAGSTETTSGVDLRSLGMTQQEIDRWQNDGIANVANPTAASILAGFNVKTPTFLPPGLELTSKYMVSSNAPLLEQMNSDAPVTFRVTQIWGLPGDASIVMVLEQSNRPFSHGETAETALPCGASVLKGQEPAAADAGPLSGAFIYHWNRDGVDLDLTGAPVHGLTSVDFDQVVCSIIKQ